MGAAQGWPRRGRKEASSRGDGTVRVGVGVHLKEAQEQEAERGPEETSNNPPAALEARAWGIRASPPWEALGAAGLACLTAVEW